jgi:hypothetical protein
MARWLLLLVDAQHYGIFVAEMFFGLQLAPLGYLAYGPGWFPKALAIMLVVGCASYLADALAAFLLPDLSKTSSSFIAITIMSATLTPSTPSSPPETESNGHYVIRHRSI